MTQQPLWQLEETVKPSRKAAVCWLSDLVVSSENLPLDPVEIQMCSYYRVASVLGGARIRRESAVDLLSAVKKKE